LAARTYCAATQGSFSTWIEIVFNGAGRKHGRAVDARPKLGVLGQRPLAALPVRKRSLDRFGPKVGLGQRLGEAEPVHHGVTGALGEIGRHGVRGVPPTQQCAPPTSA